jgi:hypothetical protein
MPFFLRLPCSDEKSNLGRFGNFHRKSQTSVQNRKVLQKIEKFCGKIESSIEDEKVSAENLKLRSKIQIFHRKSKSSAEVGANSAEN